MKTKILSLAEATAVHAALSALNSVKAVGVNINLQNPYRRVEFDKFVYVVDYTSSEMGVTYQDLLSFAEAYKIGERS